MNLRIPKMRHHKGRDQAAVVFEDGRYRYLGPWGSDEAQRNYDCLIHEWLTNGRRAPDAQSDPAGISITDAGRLRRDGAELVQRADQGRAAEEAGA